MCVLLSIYAFIQFREHFNNRTSDLTDAKTTRVSFRKKKKSITFPSLSEITQAYTRERYDITGPCPAPLRTD
jgi:CRISPR/Cas system endoribonuclease Cas6 (RAMP superfamily)